MQNTSNYQNRFGSSEPAIAPGAPDSPSGDSAGRERQRLTALAGYRILDTPPESAYDEIVQLVAVLCATPMAVMTLIDEHRQWFKAQVGMAVEETEREISFCTYVIQEGGLLEVRDAYQDPRFADNPLVRGDPWIRFYAGAPLLTSDGFVLGSLAVLDRVPRELTSLQRQGLEVLARQVVSQLELRRSLEYSKTLLSERDAAQADLQDSNAQLERKVRARTEDLHRANRELESQAARARREAEFSQAVIDSL
ncbi:MAG TPA: GAF domain-containing protein, partial [Noviherbaspirillum sp.]